MKINKKDLPIILLISGVNLFTVFLVLVSPINYLYGDIFKSFNYVVINILFLTVGYLTATSLLNRYSYNPIKLISFKSDKHLFNLLLWIFLITFIFRYSYLIKYPFYELDSIIADISIGLADPRLGYKNMVLSTRPAPYPWSIYIMLTVLHNLFFISGAILWKEITTLHKTLYILCILIEIIFWYSHGTNFGIISLIVILLMAYILQSQKLKFKHLLSIITFFVIILMSFAIVMSGRLGDSSSIIDISLLSPPLTSVNHEHLILKFTPEFLHPIIILAFSYLTQGYYYLSFGFNLDYSFSFFLNQNPAASNLGNYFGFDFSNNSMVNKLSEMGIDPEVQWHSAYLWLASDYSFYFTPLYIFILGFTVGISWIISRKYNDYVFQVIFIITSGSTLFLFANNNFISHYFYTLICTILLGLLKLFLSSNDGRLKK